MKKLAALLFVFVFLVSACQPSSPSAPVATSADPTSESASVQTSASETAPTAESQTVQQPSTGPKVLTIGTLDYFPIHGWAIDTDDALSMVSWGVMETLVKIGPDGSVMPSLAASWSQVDDTTWQFNLRQDVSFSNGEKFNAEAVILALNYIKNSPTPPRGINASTFESIEAVDEFTILIKTAKPDALMPNRLTNGNTGILAPSAYTGDSGPVNFFNTGTGPFILVDYLPEQYITLVKNTGYWDGEAQLDEVTVLYIPDGQVRSIMLQTGEIDMAIHLPIAQLPILESAEGVMVSRFQQPRTNTLYMNMSREPFNDLRLRQAVAYAIDKEALVDAILEGVGMPAKGAFAPYEGWTNQDVQGLPFDPARAQELLSEAGYAPGELTITILSYPGRAELPTLAVAIQDMLSDVGINAEVRISQYTAIEADILSGNFDIFILSRGHVLENYDPQGFFNADYSCSGGYNIAHFCSEEFDSLLASTGSMADLAERTAIYKQLQAIIDEEVASVFLNHPELLNGTNDRVVNYSVYPLERIILTTDLTVSD